MATPYLCPVCLGRGIVPAGFYQYATTATNSVPEQCHTCLGTGIVWHYALKDFNFSTGYVGPYQPQDINKIKRPPDAPPIIGDPECDTHSRP